MEIAAVFVILFLAVIAVSSIVVERRMYKRRLLNHKLHAVKKRLRLGEKYWYNSSKGSLDMIHPSCWATVTGDPFFDKKKRLIIPVTLKTPNGNFDATVPEESLLEITQLNS